MADLWLMQYLCPQRHTVLAMLYSRPEQHWRDTEAKARDFMAVTQVNPWCGICGSRDLRFEHGKFQGDDWGSAIAVLMDSEAKQKLARMLFGNRQTPNPAFLISDDGRSMLCLACGHTSHNPNDVRNRYCGFCHRFLDQ